ncbi:uncharacterized protein LOC115241596 [Formica exsecta]|uniref:uncharacterized protein LOC115241596 n=1 Tax=Formica exsecta TaxID=72781 RepID=UPI001142000F|nr:uncharacterized protein LOC115241596 [Formica exsecta]
MEYEPEDPINSPLPDNNHLLQTNIEPVKPVESVESQIRSIIRAKRTMSSDSSHEYLSKTIKRLSIEKMDPRSNNKYTLDSKAPYVVYIEKIASSLSSSIPSSEVQSSAVEQFDSNSNSANSSKSSSEKTSDTMDINNADDHIDKANRKGKKSPSGIYGIIAFGKRITKFIETFKNAFDLKTIGSNKFSVLFADDYCQQVYRERIFQ